MLHGEVNEVRKYNVPESLIFDSTSLNRSSCLLLALKLVRDPKYQKYCTNDQVL